MNRIRNILLLLFVVLAFGCGGSGSDGKFSGRWRGPILLFEKSPDTCNFEQTLNDEYSVEQNDNEIIVTINDELILTGELTSDNSFEVSFAVGSGLSPTSFVLTFQNVNNGRADATYTDFQGSFTEETGLVSCTGKWQGEVTRD